MTGNVRAKTTLLLGALGFIVAGAARADVVPVAADAFVRRGATVGAANSESTRNFGNDTQLNVKIGPATNADTNRKGFVRFDLASFSPGTGSAANDVTSASLRLDVSTFSGGNATSTTFNLWGLIDGHASENFTEGAGQTNVSGPTPPNPITYFNAPGLDDSGDGVNNSTVIFANNATPLAIFTVTTGDLNKSVVVTSQALVNFLNADTNNLATFVLTRNSSGSTGNDNLLNSAFASREHATLNAPTLFINQAVPEPGSLTLVGVGAASLLSRRRRRRP